MYSDHFLSEKKHSHIYDHHSLGLTLLLSFRATTRNLSKIFIEISLHESFWFIFHDGKDPSAAVGMTLLNNELDYNSGAAREEWLGTVPCRLCVNYFHP
jgi:hypothetical protein